MLRADPMPRECDTSALLTMMASDEEAPTEKTRDELSDKSRYTWPSWSSYGRLSAKKENAETLHDCKSTHAK